MDSATFTDKLYLFSLLTFNGVAFVVICACYSKMYASIRGGREAVAPAARSDMTVAKRMALLVFTDFACWAPVAFFGLTALAGYPLIDVPKTKILLVFFYPLNSCANPYLYALLTQQYRRDLFVLLSRFGLCSRRADEYKGTGPVPCGRRRKDQRGGGGGGGGGRSGGGGGGGNDRRFNDRRGGGGGGGGVGGCRGGDGGGRGGCGSGDGDRSLVGGCSDHHRGSVMTTVTSVDSVVTCRPGSLTPLQELQLQCAANEAAGGAGGGYAFRQHDDQRQQSPSPPVLALQQHLELLPLHGQNA